MDEHLQSGTMCSSEEPLLGDDGGAAAADAAGGAHHTQRDLVRVLPGGRRPARHDAGAGLLFWRSKHQY